MRGTIRIEPATTADAAQIAAIYAHHVLHGTASWEFEPPSVEEMAARIARILDNGWPWLISRDAESRVTGFAYAGQLGVRPGYRHACEDSIYLHEDHLGRGIGTALLTALIDEAEAAGFRQMVALIAGSEPASIALHARAGFVHCGTIRSVGRKHGRWLDLIHMQRALGEGDATSPEESA